MALKRIMRTRQSGYEVGEPYVYARKVLDATEELYPELREKYVAKYYLEKP